jgi:hypothetical protein
MTGTRKLALAAALAAGLLCAAGAHAETETETEPEAAPESPAPSPDPAGDPLLGSPRPPSDLPLDDPPGPLPPAAPPADSCLSIVALSIDKSERRLWATCASGQVKTFRVALGQLPLGYKREMRDLRTPEGFYRIAEPPRGSRFHVFMLLDYPSLADADRALSNGDISPRTYLRIARAVARGEVPPQDTLLGGLIGIHGEGRDHQGESQSTDWTLGCIALSDSDAEYIAFRVDVGTPVKIEP